MGLDYHNPNLWVRLLGRANESKIDGIKSESLINSGAMISMMSKEYFDKHGYETTFRSTSSNRRQWKARHPLFGLN